jgi:hypothetical protein
MRFQRLPFLFSALIVLIFSACSSEYHWVKVKSKDPVLVKKWDDPQSLSREENSRETLNSSISLNTQEGTLKNVETVKTRSHGLASISRESVMEKSRAIEKSLDANRKLELASTDGTVQKEALKKTLHEQLLKDPYFSKLSLIKQSSLENKLSQKLYKKASPYRGRGVNPLLALGLVLLLISLLFISSGSVYAVIGVLFSVILIILGLVQGIGF